MALTTHEAVSALVRPAGPEPCVLRFLGAPENPGTNGPTAPAPLYFSPSRSSGPATVFLFRASPMRIYPGGTSVLGTTAARIVRGGGGGAEPGSSVFALPRNARRARNTRHGDLSARIGSESSAFCSPSCTGAGRRSHSHPGRYAIEQTAAGVKCASLGAYDTSLPLVSTRHPASARDTASASEVIPLALPQTYVLANHGALA